MFESLRVLTIVSAAWPLQKLHHGAACKTTLQTRRQTDSQEIDIGSNLIKEEEVRGKEGREAEGGKWSEERREGRGGEGEQQEGSQGGKGKRKDVSSKGRL